MKTEEIQLFELFMQTICSTSISSSLNEFDPRTAQTHTLAHLLGKQETIMTSLATKLDSDGENSLATTIKTLEKAILDENLVTPRKTRQHKRLLNNYVYPIV